MVTGKKKTRKAVKKAAPIAVEAAVELEPEMITCPVCHGTKIQELHHGLLTFKCRKCDGEGKIKAR